MLTQDVVNSLASQFRLEPSKQHKGSDGIVRFYLTQDLDVGKKYLQASVRYQPSTVGSGIRNIEAHVGLYDERKIADDGHVQYDSIEQAIEDIAERFKRLRGY